MNDDRKAAAIRDAFKLSALWMRFEAAYKLAEAAALEGKADEAETHLRDAHDLLDAHHQTKIAVHTGLRLDHEG